MLAFVLADALLELTGGDRMEDVSCAPRRAPRARVSLIAERPSGRVFLADLICPAGLASSGMRYPNHERASGGLLPYGIMRAAIWQSRPANPARISDVIRTWRSRAGPCPLAGVAARTPARACSSPSLRRGGVGLPGLAGEDASAVLRISGARSPGAARAATRPRNRTVSIAWPHRHARRGGVGIAEGGVCGCAPNRALGNADPLSRLDTDLARNRSRPSSCVCPMASSADPRVLRVWRSGKRAHSAFDGEGARLAGVALNRRGTRMIYTSQLSLAALEILVHCEPSLLPADLGVAIPAGYPRLDGRRAHRRTAAAVRLAPDAVARRPAELGSGWLPARSPVLSVPSAVVPRERNYLLNPVHPDFERDRARPRGTLRSIRG